MEIERKFLVRGRPWEGQHGQRLVQGYLAERGGVTVRVRLADDVAWLTVKGPTQGTRRVEVEVEVPVEEASQLLPLCGDRLVSKVRYHLPVGDHTWDLDVFDGVNAGLVVAEVELDAEDEAFVSPSWLGDEVTDDARYVNACLAKRPFSTWGTP